MAFYSMPPLLAPRSPGPDATPQERSEWEDRLVAFLGNLSVSMEELGDAYVSVTDQLQDTIVSRPKLTFDIQVDLSSAETVFNETVNYRATGAPSNSPVPATFQATVQNDGSVSYLLSWTYTQGTRKAQNFAVFLNNADATPTNTAAHFVTQARETTTGSYSTFMQIDGAAQDQTLSFAVAAFRYSEQGIEMGTIVGSAAAPDWQGVTQGTPNYLGNISGRRQHSWSIQCAGAAATDPTILIQKDSTIVYKTTGASGLTAARSYMLTVHNLNSDTITFGPQAYDIYLWRAEAVNLRQRLRNITSVAEMCIVMGSTRPLENRLTDAPRLTFTSASAARVWGVDQTISGLTTDATYTFGVWYRVTSIGTSGSFRAQINNVATVVNATAVNSAVIPFLYGSHTFTASATSLTIRLASNNATALTGFFMEPRFQAGTAITVTASSASNLVQGSTFEGTHAAWVYTGGGPDTTAGDALSFQSLTEYRGLSTAMVDKGASRQLFENDAFQDQSAYILVGTHLCGEGNGVQVYAGATAASTAASAKLTFKTEDTEIVSLSGQGWQPTLSPGTPTNNPSPSAITITSRDTGIQIVEFTWTYTQPALEGANRLADGFIFYVASGDVADPSASPIAAYLIDVEKRSFTMQAPYNQTWSASIASFRRTASGIERGASQASSSSPDWRGIAGSQQIITGGILTSAITSALLSSACVTTVKVIADAITTAKRQDISTQSVAATVAARTSTALAGVGISFSHSIGKVPTVTTHNNNIGFVTVGFVNTATITSQLWNNSYSVQTTTVTIDYW